METALRRLVFRHVFLLPSKNADGMARRPGGARRDRRTERSALTIHIIKTCRRTALPARAMHREALPFVDRLLKLH